MSDALQIQRLEKQLAQDDAHMQQTEAQFKAEAARFLRQWWWDLAAQTVQRAPQVARTQGPDGIAAMKARVSALREGADEIVERHLGDPAVWWHKLPLEARTCEFRYVFRSQRVGPKPLDRGLRMAAGAIAPILLDFGYIEPERLAQWIDEDEDEGGEGREDGAVAEAQDPATARYCYPYTLDWPQTLLKTAWTYATCARRGANRLQDLRVVLGQQDKEAEEASTLWGDP